jgi:hypothetical protein
MSLDPSASLARARPRVGVCGATPVAVEGLRAPPSRRFVFYASLETRRVRPRRFESSR